MKGLTFDLQRFTTWLVTQNTDGSLTLTDESNAETTKDLNLSGATQMYNLNEFAGDTLKLNGDITVKRTATLSGATVTLDLNGHTWQQNEVDPFTAEVTTKLPNGQTITNNVNYRPTTLFQISTGGNLIINDSSAGKTGAIVINENVTVADSAKVLVILTGGAAVLNGGSLINNGKNVKGNTKEIFAVQLNNASNATFTMNGGSISVPNEASETSKAIRCISVVGSTTVTVNGGTITSAGYGIDTNADIVVTGGTIETTGAAVNVLKSKNESTATISGGTIKSASGAAVNFDAPNGSIEISGGTFTGDITVNSESTLDVADSYSSKVKIPVTVDLKTTYYTIDDWATAKDTLVAKTVDQTTQYFTDEGWAEIQSKILTPTLSKSGLNAVVTFAAGDNFVEGTNIIEAKLNGKVQYFTTVDNCKALLKSCNSESLNGEAQYFQSDVWSKLKPSLTKITLDSKTVYYTADKWATVEGTLYKAYLDDVEKYYSNEAKRTSAIKSYTYTAVIDGETRNYSTEEKMTAAIDGKPSLEIDGTTKYYTTADKAQAARDNAIKAIIDNEEKLFSSDETLAAAVEGLNAVTVDGVTKYFTNADDATSAVDGTTAVTIDGTTKYFTTDELAAAATSDCIAKIGDDKYFSTLQAAVNAVKAEEIITLLKDASGNGVQVESGKNFTLDFNGHIYDVDGTTVGSEGTKTQAFQLLKDSTITFKNGTITSSVAKMLVQNYSNLTLENMTLDGSKLVGTAPYTSSNNNGTINVTGNTSIIAREDGYAFDVSFANTSYPTGPQVTIDTTGEIGAINFNTWKQGGDEFKGSLTIKNGTIGEITINDDALTLGALDKITIEGGSFANSAIKAGATLLVVDNVLVAKGWNSASDGYFYVAAPAEGNKGTKLITVSGVTSTDQIKFDSEKQIFAVPTSATTSDLAEGYKTVKVAYDANSTTATVTTTENAIEITEKLLADTVTKISASGNANTVYISGGDKVNSIVGGSKDDTLEGSNTNITLTGGEGADIFVAGEKITITDYGTGSDKISVGADAGTPDIKVSGKNLVLTLGGNTVNLLNAADKVVTVTNEDGDSYYSKDGQTSDDGSTVTLPASTKTYTAKAPIQNVDGSKTAGVNITGNALDNVLTGGAGNDKLLGDKGDDTLKASAGNDTLTGGKGDDVFVQGAGNAVITDYSASGSNGADKISLDASPTSFKFSGSNLVLTFDDERTLTVNGAKNKALTFAGDENDTVRTYIDNGAVSEDGKVTLDENFKGAGQNISKVNDVTQIDASTATRNLNLVGNNLGNTLKGGTGNDTLTGGTTAADELTGGEGSDTFVYNGGEDTITDYAAEDTLKLTKNFSIKSAAFGEKDVVFTLNAAKNVVTLKDAADKTITVKDGSNQLWTYNKNFTSHGNGVTLQSTATAFDASGDAWKNLVTLDGSAASAVKLTGNAKNNVFVGTKGADTFVYSAGSDVITNYDATDKVQVDNFSSITAAKFGTKTVLTVGKGAITFNNAPKEINLVDSKNNSATLTNAGIVTEDGIQLFNGTKTYSGTASTVDASNVKNAVTLAGGSKAQTFTGAAGRTVYTFDGTGTMTIENYAAGDKVSVKGSVTNFAVADGDITLTVGEGSIVLKDAANKLITLHDDANKAGQFTARAYPQTGVTADKAIPTAVTLAADVGTYAAPQTVKQITYTGGNVTITKFDTTKGKINHGTLAITDVSETALAFGTGNTLTIGDLESDTKVQLTGTVNNKTVNSTVYLGEHVLYNNVSANATAVSVTGGSEFTAGDKVNSVTALGSEKLSIAGNTRNNTLTANDAGNTLNGKAGTDVLIGGSGADIFIHDKITGTTTINGYMSGDSIKLGEELSIVGSAYSPSSKNGTLTLTVANNDNASTSKIVIKSDDFKKADAATYGTIILDGTSTSYGKNAIYDDDEVKLLSTYSGKFTVTEGGQVDGSDVTKTLTLQGTTGDETLTGGAYKTTLTGGKGDDSLHGGKGADVFTYAKGDGKDVIADFTYNDDKLKVSTGKLIKDISVDGNDLKFDMTDGGSVTIEDVATDDFVIKANSTLYWFDGGDLVTAKTNTADMTKIINDRSGSYAVVNLDYSTDLVTAKIATYTDATFSADTYKKTT